MRLNKDREYVTELIRINDVTLKKDYHGNDLLMIRVTDFIEGEKNIYSIHVKDASRYEEFKNLIGTKKSFVLTFDEENGRAYLKE